MVWYPAYLSSKQEIVDWAIDQRPDLTTGMIPDVDLKMVDTLIFAYLNENGITVTYDGEVSGSQVSPADISNFLWAASLAYNLEFLSMRGTIHYSHGGLARTTFGKVSYEFMRMQPMFFIPQGSEGLDKMMPFRSYKQLAQVFIDAYIKAYQRQNDGRVTAAPLFTWDATSRGYGWNADLDDYLGVADAELSGTSY